MSLYSEAYTNAIRNKRIKNYLHNGGSFFGMKKPRFGGGAG